LFRAFVFPGDHPLQERFSAATWNGIGMHVLDNFVVWDEQLGRMARFVQYALNGLGVELYECALDGQHGPSWVAGWSLMRRLLGMDALQGILQETWKDASGVLAISEKLARSCGSWFPLESVCFISERTSAVRRDSRRQLHSPDGFAAEYPDGWGICAWHGSPVPKAWLFDKEKSVSLVLSWPDMRERRALAEILGWERLVRELHVTTVDADPDSAVGTLFVAKAPEGTAVHFLRDAEGDLLRVPPGTKTARDAKSWTSSAPVLGVRLELRKPQYRLLVYLADVETTLRTLGPWVEVRTFEVQCQREHTELGWRWTNPGLATATFCIDGEDPAP
jgi:hypothetical protein